MSGFSAKEFEPDPTAVPGDDDDDEMPAARRLVLGIIVAASLRNTPRLAKRCSG